MRRVSVFLSVIACVVPAFAGDRVTGEEWMSYADPTEAGFDGERLKPALKLLELNAENTNAEEMIARIKGGGDENE
jgi:hypothetical protein